MKKNIILIKYLSELEIGEKGIVQSITGDQDTKRRLLEMGFCNKTEVCVVRKAPLGDPVQYKLRDYNLVLRLEQAKQIIVEI